MKKSTKIFIVVFSAITLLISASIGTYAYLTSKAQVTNTFTVGKVSITLDEGKTNEYGEPVTPEERVDGNQYRLIPGLTYSKDPTVTVLKGSEKSYVRVIMKITNRAAMDAIIAEPRHGLTDYSSLLVDWDPVQWEYYGLYNEAENSANDIIAFEFRYREVDDTGAVISKHADGYDDNGGEEENKLTPVFTGLTLPGTVTYEELMPLTGLEISLEAHAMQAIGFEIDENKAWEAFEEQVAALAATTTATPSDDETTQTPIAPSETSKNTDASDTGNAGDAGNAGATTMPGDAGNAGNAGDAGDAGDAGAMTSTPGDDPNAGATPSTPDSGLAAETTQTP